MNRQRYEPVAQRDEVIILDSIQGSSHYNYNTAVPTSVPSSIAPSIAPSITSSTLSRNATPTPPQYSGAPPPFSPSSPPPSFRTLSSPGTPRPAHSIRTAHSNPSSYAELWGVAASTVGGTMTETGTEGGRGIGTSNDALATIARLRTRVEWLEESIGRLLIEKDALYAQQISNRDDCGQSSNSRDDSGNGGLGSSRHGNSNCCVTFTSTTPDLERAIASGGRNNCCVTFRSSTQRAESERRRGNVLKAVRLIFFALVVMFVTLGVSGRGGSREAIRIGSVDEGMAGEGAVHVGAMGMGIEKTSEVVGRSGLDLD